MRSATPSSPSVLALILTHNAPDALSQCVAAVRAQTHPPDDLIVVDNASNPPASLDLNGSAGSVYRSSENLGPAGGHSIGLEMFLQSGHDIAWVMDDDCTPESRCLEVLLAAVHETADPVLTFPTWIDQRSGEVTNYPAWCGFVIPREIVAVVGLPRSDFFWWMEDTEYLRWRIPSAGFEVQRADEAVVWHGAVRRKATKPTWKIYYETRNSIYFRVHIQRGSRRWRLYRLLRVVMRTPARILVHEDHKLAKLRMFVRGVLDGLLGRLGIRVPPPGHQPSVAEGPAPLRTQDSATSDGPIDRNDRRSNGERRA